MKNILNQEVDNRIETLKINFPECFDKDGNFNIQKFDEILNPNLKIFKDSYGIGWLGKSYAKRLTSIPISTVLQEDLEHNQEELNKNSENIYIKGDNLEVLRHLSSAYSNKIKLIYIDPPYNTQNGEFVYNDNREFSEKELNLMVEEEIISEGERDRILDWTDKKSSSHSAWLTFMYPRLYLARKLLRNDGVIFISIDDNENSQLKLLCDEIFGEENFLSQVIVQSNKRGQTYKQLAKTHEYMFIYTKSTETIINELSNELGKFEFKDAIGEFSIRELRNRNPKFGKFNRPNLYYPFYVNPNKFDEDGFYAISLTPTEEFTEIIYPLNSEGKESCWRWGVDKSKANFFINEPYKSNLVGKLKKTGQFGIYEKYRKTTYKDKTIWFEATLGNECENSEGDIWEEKGVITEQGSLELANLSLNGVFSFPKPLYLIKKVITLGSNSGDIILDFFSGSATTAHAVMDLNADDEGDRKYIMVQLEEKLTEGTEGYKYCIDNNLPTNITSLGIERIKKAAEKIKKEKNADIDYGFKIYSIKDVPNNLIIDDSFDPTVKTLFEKNPLTVDEKNALLTTYKVFDGNLLSEKIKSLFIGENEVYLIQDVLYVLNEIRSRNFVKELLEKIDKDKEFIVNKIIIYGYESTDGKFRKELTENIKSYNNKKNATINVEVRY